MDTSLLWVMVAIYILIDIGYVVLLVYLVKGICEMWRAGKERERDKLEVEIKPIIRRRRAR